MSGDLEKFVLQYNVELKDSIERLERLNQKVAQTNKAAKGASSELKEFGKNALSEVSKLTPELNSATSAAMRLTGGLLGTGAALAVIAVGIKSIIDLRKEYDAQRKLSFESGLSVQEVEQFQRTSARSSRLNAGQSRDLVGRISSMSMSAYTNPDPMSREQLMLRQLGSSAFESNGRLKDTMKIIDEIAKKMQSVSKERAYAMGQAAGMTHDEVDAIRKRTDLMKKNTQMSKDDIAVQQQGAAALEVFNQQYNILIDKFRQASNSIAAQLMPALTDLIDWFSETFDKVSGWLKSWTTDYSEGFKKMMAASIGDQAKVAEIEEKIAKEDAERKAKLQQDSARAAREQQATFSRDINLFAAAVSTFAGVIDERQAWAAWAGEVGRNSGAGAAGGAWSRETGAHQGTPVSGTSVAPAEYDRIINQAAVNNDVDPNILKKMIQVESGYNPNAVGPMTKWGEAKGLGQILPGNYKSLGITNPFDPEQNINGMAKLMSEYMKASGGDVRKALTMYHGGYNEKNWGAMTRAYPDKVFNANVNYGGGNADRPAGAPMVPVANNGDKDYSRVNYGDKYAPVSGDTRGDVQKRLIQDAIAKELHVPLEQLQLGGVAQGDVHFTRAKLESQMIRDVTQKELLYKAPGIRPMEQAQAYQDFLKAQNNLRALQKYGREIETSSRPGGRDITLQEKAIFIQVDGAGDPNAVANEVVRKLYSTDLGDIVNGSATAIKY